MTKPSALKEYHQCLVRTGVIRLRAKHRLSGRYSIPLPTPTSGFSTSNTCFAPIAPAKSLPADAKTFPVGHLHKQGLQLITPGDLSNLGDFGGRKR